MTGISSGDIGSSNKCVQLHCQQLAQTARVCVKLHCQQLSQEGVIHDLHFFWRDRIVKQMCSVAPPEET
jgi:hypothetical protein